MLTKPHAHMEKAGTLEVTLEDFARSFGTTAQDIHDRCRAFIAQKDFRYRILTGRERDRVILDALKRAETDTQRVGTSDRKVAWEQGWMENVAAFQQSRFDLNALVPKFIRPSAIIRLYGEFVEPVDPNFELNYFSVFRLWAFNKFLNGVHNVYEFGCGTGFNLVALAQMYPDKHLHGLDFSSASVNLVRQIASVYRWNMSGHLFDMTAPDQNVMLQPNSAVLTFGAIEQLADNIEPFLDFLLARKPALCLSLEPTIDLYDEDDLFDYLAIKFHKRRGYTATYLQRLRQLENEGRIEILRAKRLFFGSKFMEGFTYILWRPAVMLAT